MQDVRLSRVRLGGFFGGFLKAGWWWDEPGVGKKMRRISHRCAKECRGENAKGRKQKEEITISASRSELQLLGRRFFDDVGAC